MPKLRNQDILDRCLVIAVTAITVAGVNDVGLLPYQKIKDVPEWILAGARNVPEYEVAAALLAFREAGYARNIEEQNKVVEHLLAAGRKLSGTSWLRARIKEHVCQNRRTNLLLATDRRDFLAEVN